MIKANEKGNVSIIEEPFMGYSRTIWKRMWAHRVYYLMMLPGIVCLVLFHYMPIGGLLLAFKDFSFVGGPLSGPFVGLKYFERAFNDKYFINALQNTITISLSRLVIGFPLPIILALLLHEIPSIRYKKIAQGVSFLPTFISWVVLASIFTNIFSLGGPINYVIETFGGKPIIFLGEPTLIVQIIVGTSIWQTLGWSSVIYTAALAGVNPELYEAAVIDGAGKLKQIFFISIPCISNVIIILLILSLGGILNAGFDQIFNMMKPTTTSRLEILDTYVFKMGIERINYSYATAVGLFKSVVGLVFVLSANFLAGKIGGKESKVF